MVKTRLFLLVSGLLVVFSFPALAAPAFSAFHDLGGLGSSKTDSWILWNMPSRAWADNLNDSGQVVGHAYADKDGYLGMRTFLWTAADGMSDAGDYYFGGFMDYSASGINAAGQMCGTCYGHYAGYTNGIYKPDTTHPEVWWIPMGYVTGGNYVEARAINASGVATGACTLGANVNYRPFTWSSAQGDGVTPIGDLEGDASDINDSGQVAGCAFFPGFTSNHAAVWTKVGGTWTVSDLGTINGGPFSNALAINALGDTVGFTQVSPGAGLWDRHPFYCPAGGAMQDISSSALGTGNGYARDINSRKEIVGTYEDYSGNYYAFLWIQGAMYDLSDLAQAAGFDCGKTSSYRYGLIDATGINENGDIIGLLWDRTTSEMGAFFLARQMARVSVQGTVQLADFSGDYAGVGLTVDFRQGGTSTLKARTLLDAGGGFKIDNVPEETYDIAIKACAWLQKVLTGVALSGTSVDLGTIALVSGDNDGDNAVTSTDLSVVLTHIDAMGD